MILATTCVTAQNQWFQTYADSTALVNDATHISNKFISDITSLNPETKLDVEVVLDTSPYLIYYGFDKKIHLPLWEQVMPQLKSFFTDVAGSEEEGEKMFGLFFNGFYLTHELGHGLQESVKGKLEQSYDGEHLANTIAILWWRKNGNLEELESCYQLAKQMTTKLTNPVPDGMTTEEFFTTNYGEATQNPYTYGYMQFRQFVDIYENKSLPDFNTYIKEFLKQ